jgi:hypothetical protein
MNKTLLYLLLLPFFPGCDKSTEETISNTACDMNTTYTRNASKTNISNGIYGTVSSMEGNCMPMVQPSSNTCTHCPVNRTLRVHALTRSQDATSVSGKPGFYTSVNTLLIREITTDNEGFFQVELPPGQYSVFILENGWLHAASMDGNGGLNTVTVTSGRQKMDLKMMYKAVF